MRRKIIGMLICTLVIVTAFPITGTTQEFSTSNDGGELDQHQDVTDDRLNALDHPQWEAQSFIPTMNVICKVEICIERKGTPNDLFVGIRSDLTGPNLASTIIKSGNIPTTPSWIKVDFTDIYIPAPQTCYIVITETGEFTSDDYWIYGSRWNPYEFGSRFLSNDHGETWKKYSGHDLAFRTYGGMDTPPHSPTIKGPLSGKVGVKHEYIFNAVDPDGDDVKYFIDWGDGDVETIAFYPSGEDVKVNHTWSEKGTFIINATVIDIYFAESNWTNFEVTITKKTRAMNTPFLNFLENHPILYQLLQRFLRL